MTDSAAPIDWQAEALRAELAPLLPGLVVEIAASVGSTNTVLIDRIRARSGAAFGPLAGALPEPGWLLVAERQTAGRGRQGRRWHSAPGRSLTFTLALPLAAADWSGLSLAVGVALAEALDPLPPTGPSARNAAADPIEVTHPTGSTASTGCTGPVRPPEPRLGLKWPNDLWLHDRSERGAVGAPGGRKLGGILVETVVAAGGRRVAVVGVGLNVGVVDIVDTKADVSTGIAGLHELDPRLTAPAALHRVARPLIEALQRFERDGFGAFAAGFARRDVLRGRAVATTSPAAAEGIGRGLAANGALRIERADGEMAEVSSGEVSVRPILRDGCPACAESARC